jgi:3-oxoacyl-[acyl-carrier protein] reductase
VTRVLVTGATGGIGRAIVRALVERGDEVVGVHRRDVDAMAGVEMMQCDLDDDTSVRALARRVADRSLGGVVCAAGVTAHATIDGEDDVLDRQLDTNLRAPLVLVRELLRANAIADAASIVLVGSNLARHGQAQRVAYAAAKAGLEGATRSLARELAPRRIRVNTVAPGLLRTEMTVKLTDDDVASYERSVPLGRIGRGEDIAPLVAFLLGEGAAYITGQIIDVDGGWGC